LPVPLVVALLLLRCCCHRHSRRSRASNLLLFCLRKGNRQWKLWRWDPCSPTVVSFLKFSKLVIIIIKKSILSLSLSLCVCVVLSFILAGSLSLRFVSLCCSAYLVQILY
jgi:hypothetical protein